METTLSSKGQVVIPLRVRQNHGWKPGVRFTVIDSGEELVLKPALSRETTQLADVIGCAGYSGPAKTLAEMEAGIGDEARAQAASWSR